MTPKSRLDERAPRIRRAALAAGALALAAALLAAVVACHTPARRAAEPGPAAPSPPRAPADDSYDWHGLLIAPFGSVLKDIPLRLHEVLLFRDEQHGAAAADDAAGVAAADDAAAVAAECYAADAPAPRFAGRAPEEYVLCFKQNRLSRIQATVLLTAAEAPGELAAVCAAANAPAAPAGAACEGLDGAIHFSARLEEEPGRADMPPTEKGLSITLNSASEP
jgi:hypothetical protein